MVSPAAGTRSFDVQRHGGHRLDGQATSACERCVVAALYG